MIVSVETVETGPLRMPSGVWKVVPEPVIVALGDVSISGGHLVCPLLFLHAHLRPGWYELSSGHEVLITRNLVSGKMMVHEDAELELKGYERSREENHANE